jgi:hypothetical protein
MATKTQPAAPAAPARLGVAPNARTRAYYAGVALAVHGHANGITPAMVAYVHTFCPVNNVETTICLRNAWHALRGYHLHHTAAVLAGGAGGPVPAGATPNAKPKTPKTPKPKTPPVANATPANAPSAPVAQPAPAVRPGGVGTIGPAGL